MYKIMFIMSIAVTAIAMVTGAISSSIVPVVIILLLCVNAGYGGGFSNLPTLLSDHYGMKTISAIHGIALSAWAFAGLTGNNLSNWIVNKFGKWVDIEYHGEMIQVNPTGYQTVLYVTLTLYIVALIISFVMVPKPSQNKE